MVRDGEGSQREEETEGEEKTTQQQQQHLTDSVTSLVQMS